MQTVSTFKKNKKIKNESTLVKALTALVLLAECLYKHFYSHTLATLHSSRGALLKIKCDPTHLPEGSVR